MSFVPATRASIRAYFLSQLAARYEGEGRTLDVSETSDAYKRADAFAVTVAPIAQQAAQQVADTFIDTASPEAVESHARTYGIARRAAVAAVLQVEVNGSASARVEATSDLSAGGALFELVDSRLALDSSGVGFVLVRALEAGRAGNLAPGTELVWTSGAPAGIASSVTVASVATAGEDAEGTEELRARVLARLRQRAGSGNCEDWRAWAEDCDGVESAFVYPLLEPPTVTGDVLGCVSVVVMGPARGDSPTDSRTIPTERLDEIHGYIAGDRDASGAPSPSAHPLYPAGMSESDFGVFGAGASSVDVHLQVKNLARYPFPFSGSLTLTGSPTATEIQVVGNHLAKTGARALLRVGSSLVRGGWQVTELRSGAYDGVNTTFQVDLLGAPALAGVYPAPPNWEALRLAVFALFDSLGPRDTTPPRRWPAIDTGYPDTLYRGALQTAAHSVRGVTSAAVVAPASDFAPTDAKQLATLGLLLVTELP
jgi:hypothetical protein